MVLQNWSQVVVSGTVCQEFLLIDLVTSSQIFRHFVEDSVSQFVPADEGVDMEGSRNVGRYLPTSRGQSS